MENIDPSMVCSHHGGLLMILFQVDAQRVSSVKWVRKAMIVPAVHQKAQISLATSSISPSNQAELAQSKSKQNGTSSFEVVLVKDECYNKSLGSCTRDPLRS